MALTPGWFTKITALRFGSTGSSPITAHAGGGQSSAIALKKGVNQISTVATSGDSVALPVAASGAIILVVNTGANPVAVFPNSTDTINGGAASASVSQMPNSVELYVCAQTGNWYVKIGTGFAGALVTDTYNEGVTAFATGGQASATPLTGILNRVTTVATAGDSIALPVATPGLDLIVINHGANPMQVFGAGTDTIDDVATATGVTQMAGSLCIYSCTFAGKWYSNGLGNGYSGSFPTVSFTTGITAHAGGGQASAVALTTVINRVTTVAAQGDSVALPAASAGLAIILINKGANPMQVFGSGTDTINGIATATGISQGINTASTFVCTVAGNWEVPINSLQSSTPQAITASGAIPPHAGHFYTVTKAGVAALTLAAPTAGTDDGIEIAITSTTAFAHTLTATGLLQTGTASVNLATFAAQPGAGLTLMAVNGKLNVLAAVGITFS